MIFSELRSSVVWIFLLVGTDLRSPESLAVVADHEFVVSRAHVGAARA